MYSITQDSTNGILQTVGITVGDSERYQLNVNDRILYQELISIINPGSYLNNDVVKYKKESKEKTVRISHFEENPGQAGMPPEPPIYLTDFGPADMLLIPPPTKNSLPLVKQIQSGLKNLSEKIKNKFKGTGNTSTLRTQGKPYENHSTVTGRNLPTTGKSNSSVDLYDENGTLKQRRYYDENGRVKEDIDYEHSNGDNSHEFPHRHTWDWSSGSPKRSK